MQILIILLALLLGCFGAFVIQKYGYWFGIIDVPNERSSHNQIVTKGGGIGILAAFVFCAFFLGLSGTFWVPALFLSIVSLFGDRVELSAKLRLIVQFICSLVFLAGLLPSYHAHYAVYFLSLPFAVYIVGTSNFYNFMDGVNGIAGITGVVGFMLIAAYGAVSGAESIYITLCIAVAFSCAGFLPFNIPNAKVFMGDVGSILLGFVFACMVVIFSKCLLDFICLAGLLFPFYADELITMVVRIKNGDSLGNAHRKHIYQLLANEYGIEHWKISVGYGFLQLLIGVLLIILKNSGYIPVLSLLLCCFVGFSLFSAIIRMKLKKYHEVGEG